MARPRFSRRHSVAGPIILLIVVVALVAGCAALMPNRTDTLGALAAFGVIVAAMAVLVGPARMRSGRV